MNNDGFPGQLVGLFPFQQEDQTRKGENQSQATGGPGVTNDRTDGREEASHQRANHEQDHVEGDDVEGRRPNVVEKGVHHLQK